MVLTERAFGASGLASPCPFLGATSVLIFESLVSDSSCSVSCCHLVVQAIGFSGR